jgi:energy-coupling factor transporter ATP-binding protein EcfA2
MDARLIGKDIEKILEIYSELEIDKKTKKKDEDFVKLFKRLHKLEQTQQQPLRLLILGKPGSGKTTLMKWIALQCLKKEKAPFFSQFIPVFISLKDLGKDPDHTFRKKNIVNLTVQILEEENISAESFLDHQLKANRLLFLLDGLDEIGDEKVRREVIQWIQKQYIYKSALIVTSRFSGLHRASGLEFREDIPAFAIQDFEMEDVDAFLQNWYRDVEIAVTGELYVQKAVEQGEKKHKDLMNIIKDHDKLKELAVNPLLLTIIAIVHRTRAVLPRERHKLYEECLKVMIELWNLANRKLDISFSYDNSMAHLAKIAVLLMESERREIGKKEIEECCLPLEIESQSRDMFLKEMVVKAGLLYESEGKYGFLHHTFQEFMAAWFFAHGKNQNEILKHHHKNYWQETFKLFVNIGNAELFFEEVIDQLMEKDYWKHMDFWEDCLKEIVVENRKESIELRFAKKVMGVLSGIKYTKANEDENDALISALYHHYPLYKHGRQLAAEGWELFFNAPHPSVQSVGTSILARVDEKTREELMLQIKNRIDAFEKQKHEKDSILLDFLLGNNNGLKLLLVGSKKVTDFNFALAKLKSGKIFIQFLYLRALWELQALPFFRALRDLLTKRDLRDMQGLLELLDLRALLDLLYLPVVQVMRYRQTFPVIPYYKKILAEYNKKYKAIITTHRQEILDWTDRAIEKLHNLTDKEIKKYFPNTTKEELKAFRDS